jgi:hypothetical protein
MVEELVPGIGKAGQAPVAAVLVYYFFTRRVAIDRGMGIFPVL